MVSNNSPINCTSRDLEIEAIRRFRDFVPLLAPECEVFRSLNGRSTLLCLDFRACPQNLKMTQKEWLEFAYFSIYSSHYLGLANSLVLKIGDHAVPAFG